MVLASVLSGATGCSFGMRTAPSDPGKRTVRAARACAADTYYPFFDSVSTGVGVYNIVVSTTARDKVSIYGQEMGKKTGLTLGIAQAALFGLGAAYGYVQIARCNALNRERGFDPSRGALVDGRWQLQRARPRSEAGDSKASAPRSDDDRPVLLAPGSEDDRPPRPSAEGKAARPAPSMKASSGTELPSWSAFRRFPLPPETPPRAPAKGSP